MRTPLDTLISYVPPPVARWYSGAPEPLREPRANRYPGAVLFADITGFTDLTERLAADGSGGAEALTHILNTYFGQLVDVISQHGGEVVEFAGDGLLALWSNAEWEIPEATRRATQCGLVIQQVFRDYETSTGERLRLSICIGCGDVFGAHVGGVAEQWLFVAAGEPLTQVSLASERVQPGDVALSAEAWAHLSTYCRGQVLDRGLVRLQGIDERLPPQAAPDVTPVAAMETAIRRYVPRAALARLDAGHRDWLAEMRNVSVLFVQLRDMDTTGPDALVRAHTAMCAFQEILLRYGGVVDKMMVDADGPVCVAAFGIPPMTHEDDASRAVHAALDVKAALRDISANITIGIASGRAFCGPVGSERRREYTMIGDVVNTAARLMQSATNEVWCATSTHAATQDDFFYDALPPAALKGKAEPVVVYRPTGKRPVAQRRRDGAGRADRLVGRIAEVEIVAGSLAATRDGQGSALIIEGDEGIGKSRLVDELVGRAQRERFLCLEGAADSVERATPYYAWSPVFTALLGTDAFQNPQAMQTHVRTMVETMDPECVRLIPLLNSVIPLGMPDNEVTEQMEGKVRADNTHLLLVRLLQNQTSTGALVLILEDAQWMDTASWALTLQVFREVRSLLLVIATRPFRTETPAEFAQIADAPGAKQILLGPLGGQDALNIVCQRLGVDSLAPPVEHLIRDRAQGNPFFSEELAYALRDLGYIRIHDRTCALAPGTQDVQSLALPSTVQGVITSRIDRLEPAQQLALKAASVIGRVFPFQVLRDIYPVDSDRPQLHDHLRALHDLDLTPLETPEPNLAYTFKHIITQEVAYNLMPDTQRRALHRATAEWYEHTYTNDASPYYALLAHHWREAQDAAKALDYSAKAGASALARGAYREAVYFLREALDLDERAPSTRRLRDMPRATLVRQLGQAHLGLGQLDEAREHLEAALRLYGVGVPDGRGGLIRSLMRNALVQTAHMAWPHRFVGRAGNDRDRLLDAARTFISLGEVLYFRNQILPALHTAVVSLNLAERAGPSAVLARAYGGSSIFAGATPLKAVAQRYARLAWEHARRVDQLGVYGYVGMSTGTYAMSVGRYEEAQQYLEEGAKQLEELADHRRLAMARVALARVVAQRGDYTYSSQLADVLETSGRQHDDTEVEAWGLIGRVENALRMGASLDGGAEDLQRAITLLSESGDTLHRVRAHGLLALLHLRQSDPKAARREADVAMSVAAQAPAAPGAFEGYAGVLEVYTSLWSDNDTELCAAAVSTAERLRSLGKRFGLVESRAELWWGTVAWHRGKHRAARRAWAQGLAAAERYGAPYEQGLAHAALSRHGDAHDQSEHRRKATEAFQRIGAAYELQTLGG